MKARWHNTTIAECENWIELEGNIYFPFSAVRQEYLAPSSTTTVCSWKGTAHYFNVVVGREVNHDAAWYYPEPKEAAHKIKNYIAFWRGIEVND